MNGYIFAFIVGALTAVGVEALVVLIVAGVTAYKEHKYDKRKED